MAFYEGMDRSVRGRRSIVSRTAVPAILATFLTGISAPVLAQDTAESNVDFEVYGFAQVDLIADVDGRMNPDWKDAFRPSRIATPEGQFGSDGETSFSVKQSRLGAKASGEAGGQTWEGKFEFDMFGVGCRCRQDRGSPAPRLWQMGPDPRRPDQLAVHGRRHLPERRSTTGDPTGMVFVRTPQLRFTFIDDDGITVAAALEYAGQRHRPRRHPADRSRASQQHPGQRASSPTSTAAVRYGGDWGHVRLAGILREIRLRNRGHSRTTSPRATRSAGASTRTGSFKLADMATFRSASSMARASPRYMNDGGMDLAPSATSCPASDWPAAADLPASAAISCA